MTYNPPTRNDYKGSARVSPPLNVTVANPGTSTFDSIVVSAGNRILLKAQTTASENGLYTFDTSSTPLVRVDDVNANDETTSGLLVYVEEGTVNGGKWWYVSTINPITVGSTSVVFSELSNPPGAVIDYAGSTAPSGWFICDGTEKSRTTYAALDAVVGTTYGAYTNGAGGAGTTHFRVPDARGRAPIGKHTSGTFTTLGATGGLENVQLTEAQLADHSHSGTTLTAASHDHGVGSYQIPNHSHGGAGLTINISADNAFSATQSGTGVNRANATHTHTGTIAGNTGNLVAAPITGLSGLSGTLAISGSTGTAITAAGPAVNGADHTNIQPYIIFNKIIKY